MLAGVALMNGKLGTAWCKLACTCMLVCVTARAQMCMRVRECERVHLCLLGILRGILKYSRNALRLVYSVLQGKFPLRWNFHYKWPQSIPWKDLTVIQMFAHVHRDHHVKVESDDIFVSPIHSPSLTCVGVYDETWQNGGFGEVVCFITGPLQSEKMSDKLFVQRQGEAAN